MFYFYQILSPLNKLKTISEGVLLLPNAVTLQQVEDYIRGCSTSTKYCPPLTSWRLYQRVYYFYQILSPLNKLKTIRGCSTSTKYCRPWTSWRLYQRVFYFYQILSSFNKLKTISEGVLLLPNTVPLNKLKTISEDVLLLPNTVTLEQVEDYIRGCPNSTKYCHPWTSWRLYQRVFYFYQILSPLNKLKTISEGVLLLPNTVTLKQVEDYIRGCSTSTKYCPPLTSWRLYQRVFYFYQILSSFNKLKTISEGVLLLPNTVTPSWRLYQRVFYFYQILSSFNKLKTISEGVLLLPNTVTLEQVEDYIRGVLLLPNTVFL